MKTWTHVERHLEKKRLPYRVQDETLVTLDGRPVARTVQAVRDHLESPGHPDGKRQRRRKDHDLARYGARILKQSGVLTAPPQRVSKRRELREMRERLAVERKEQAARVAARLLGGRRTLSIVHEFATSPCGSWLCPQHGGVHAA